MEETELLTSWYYWLILGFACVLCLEHLFILPVFNWVQRRGAANKAEKHWDIRVIVTSLGGGIAIAYVFLRLLPELDDVVHFHIALFGFVVVYGINHFISKVSTRKSADKDYAEDKWRFVVSAVILFIYNVLIVYTMKEHVKHGTANIFKYMFAMILHLFGGDFGLYERQFDHFKSWGRFVLAGAPITGWLILWLCPDFGIHPDILTAVLAGFVMLNVFKEEIPENRHSSFRWFLVGVVFFAVLVMLKLP